MRTTPLDAREKRFVDEYLIDLDPQRAALAAGYSPSMARTKAYQWVSEGKRKPHVFAAVQQAMEARAKRTELTQDMVLTELRKLGFSDIRKAINWQANVTSMVEDEDGNERLAVTNEVQLIDSDKIDDATAAAISGISQMKGGGLRITFHDKRAALVDLGRHLGMFKERVEHSGPDGGPIETAELSPRDRAKALAALVLKAKRV